MTPAEDVFLPEVLSIVACRLTLVHVADADHQRYKGHGTRAVLAMRATCRAWRAAIEATDLVWFRVIQRRFPRLDIGCLSPETGRYRRRHLSWFQHYQVHQAVVRLRTAPVCEAPPPLLGNGDNNGPPLATEVGTPLSHFTFTIEAKVVSHAPTAGFSYAEEEWQREMYPKGSHESWTGVLTAASLQRGYSYDADGPSLGSLASECCNVKVSVYVTSPPPALHTFKIYDRGEIEGSDDDCGEMFSYLTRQPAPYAHPRAEWDTQGEYPAICLNEYTGRVVLRLLHDDDVGEAEWALYLCGGALEAW